ncbi:hypothetical protein VTJ83DRAFT_6182 [Remersonia thermophila]|uniref:Fibronectin type-III domain-containing protein n=1 Tax=Remersonia thermophila TaxID=72144 RepID=A0ABR4D8Y2_9PEZI
MATLQPPDEVPYAFRVMVVGDSISHGREGDWTWRYRIWQWFRKEGVAVRFVGPYTGTVPPNDPHPPRPPRCPDDPADAAPVVRTHGGYAAGVDPEFLANSAHFSGSGRLALQAKDLIAEQVAAYQPDICLVELGFNDLAWLRCDPIEVLTSIETLVHRARSAKHNLKFAIANIPHRTSLPGRDDLPLSTNRYNETLARSIPKWSLPESPIALVRFCENYSCGGNNSKAAYDGLHPNALGEFQIAQAFSRTLISAFSLGRTPLEMPSNVPARPLNVPAQLKAVSDPSGIIASWEPVYGAYGYDLHHRRAGQTRWSQTHVDCNRYYWQQLRKGDTVECRVRASGGDFLKSSWTQVVSAMAQPLTPLPPSNIRAHADTSELVISWDPPPPPPAGELDRFSVTLFDGDRTGAYPLVTGVRGNKIMIPNLIPGHKYFILLSTWSSVGQGVTAGTRAVRAGRGRPCPPRFILAKAIDSTTVEVSWPDVAGAAGYDVWYRRGFPLPCSREADSSKLVARKAPVVHDRICTGWKAIVSDLKPCVWEWEFAVTAYNGSDDSPIFRWVTAPRLTTEASLTTDDTVHITITCG